MLFTSGWDECVELQCQPRAEWAAKTAATLGSMDRWEITEVHDGVPIGGIIVALDDDIHVGPCMSVFAQYVLPEFRLQGASQRMMSRAVRLARQSGANLIAYTHRLGPWRYETIYRRLK